MPIINLMANRIKYKLGYDDNGKWYCVPEDMVPIKEVNAPAVISDELGELMHPADQKVYTSKSQFRRATRAAGLEEVGNEKDAHMNMKPTHQKSKPIEAILNSLEYHQTLEGKSEGERKEISARFFGGRGTDQE